MDELIGFYEDFVEPNKIINHFKTDEEFLRWCDLGTIEDLRCTLKAFEDAELYEYCRIIFEVLKIKMDY